MLFFRTLLIISLLISGLEASGLEDVLCSEGSFISKKKKSSRSYLEKNWSAGLAIASALVGFAVFFAAIYRKERTSTDTEWAIRELARIRERMDSSQDTVELEALETDFNKKVAGGISDEDYNNLLCKMNNLCHAISEKVVDRDQKDCFSLKAAGFYERQLD